MIFNVIETSTLDPSIFLTPESKCYQVDAYNLQAALYQRASQEVESYHAQLMADNDHPNVVYQHGYVTWYDLLMKRAITICPSLNIL